jgi:vesicle transport protein SEC22
MTIENVYIARVTDGLVLVASMEHHGSGNAGRMDDWKNQAKQILKRLNSRSAAKMSIESAPFVFQ